MKVKFKKTSENAKHPFQKYPEDFCWDLYATSCEEVAPNVYKYGLGLSFEIERDVEEIVKNYGMDMTQCPWKLSLDFRPRSSVWETGLSLSNCQGTIDELYRGEVSAVFYHVMPNMPKYKVGDRVIQAKIGITLPIEWEEVDKLSFTERGTNGYGHTGRK